MIVSLRGMVAIELATQLPDMIWNLLSGMLPGIEDSYQDEQDNRPSSPLITNYVQPLVLAHLPGLVKKYMNEQVDTNDIIGIVENNVIEECDYCLTSIREARDECLKEIAAAGTDACDRLRDVYCDGDDIRGLMPEESLGMGAERTPPLGPGLPQGSSSPGSSFRFRRRRLGRRQVDGVEPVLVEQTQPDGNHGQQDPGAQLVCEAMTTKNDDMTDEDDTINEEDDTADEEDDMHDGEDGMTDEEDDATAGHGDLGPTTLGDYEPGRQDERNRLHELVQNGSINAAGRTGHDTAAPAPPVSTLSMHPEMIDQGDGDIDVDDEVETVSMHLQTTNLGDDDMCDQTETGCSPTQEDSGMSARVEAYRRQLYVSASTVEASTARLRSPEVWQQESFLSRLDVQTGGNVRLAASAQANEGSCSGTQFQYAQVVDSRFSVPSDRSSQAQPDTELRRREDP
ncbi:hypothetical protein DBV05_g7992 [Lasiodiplodia theobromae]|uniref:Uncharacterized protein n=1 Tax=Lasiodiplodia theobromae TaxID=45133 RepID=A0A5N5D6K4_9PEZI|nr:hypothetical protein DBV05_g7992 [Lasiodiplodia theobromae]